MDELGKIRFLSFTVENKMVHLRKIIKTGQISNLMNEMVHYLSLQEFINVRKNIFACLLKLFLLIVF